MKTNFLILSILFFFSYIASGASIINQTVFEQKEVENTVADNKLLDDLQIDFFIGSRSNSSLGIYPTIGARIGKKFKKSGYFITGEIGFLNSSKSFDIAVNDDIVTRNPAIGDFAGLEYERLLFSKGRHELNALAGIGYDWIKMKVVDDESLFFGGLSYKTGLGYLFKVKNNAGIQSQFLYNYSNININSSAKLDNNTFIIRVTYTLGFKE
ncbi:hypothetical protein [uncultured Draconibacterium sp.]|uniref:hypothetical protein n=1 Tax=uncultured Draconibacterium sp. TaxID=1573823 RepID=UPI0029C6A329|nr:hypothetical protein [uncultured Draconibacterium sp.]